MFDACITVKPGAVRLKLHVHPGAKRNGFSGIFGDAVKLDLQTPPVDGKANAALLKFLAKLLKCPKSSISIVSGESSRDKILEFNSIDKDTLLNFLNGNIS